MGRWFNNKTKLEAQTDLALVELCNNNKGRSAAAAFGVLYERHKDFVLRTSQRYGADSAVALDVLQDTFMSLLGKFPPSGTGLQLSAELTTLLYPIAKNRTLNLGRRNARDKILDVESLEQLGPVVEDAPLAGRDVPQLLGELSPEHREVVLLRVVDELQLQEIALALHIPLGTVKSRLHAALAQLRKTPEVKKLLDL